MARRSTSARTSSSQRAERAELESLPAPIPDEELPSPLEHASPDVELADAQIALGRAELDAHSEIMTDEEWAEEEAEGRGGGASDDGPPADGTGSGGGDLVPGGAAAPTHRRAPGSRLITLPAGKLARASAGTVA